MSSPCAFLQPQIMGILNVTPDSFYDGGRYSTLEKQLTHARKMLEEGATIIDVGGESTRPGAEEVSAQEECDRVLPLIESLRQESDCLISIDSRKTLVMQAALQAGANFVNDVNALLDDQAIALVSKAKVPVCLMHAKGSPKTMQKTPFYENVVEEVGQYLLSRAKTCEQSGILPENIILDPGFGFGKTLQHNLQLLKHLEKITALNYPVLIGVSRKSMFGQILGEDLDARLIGSIAASVMALQKGATIIRAHDVAKTLEAVKIFDAIEASDKKTEH